MVLVCVFTILYFLLLFQSVLSLLIKKFCSKTVCCIMPAAASYISCLLHPDYISISCAWLNLVLFCAVTYSGLQLRSSRLYHIARCLAGHAIQVCVHALCDVRRTTESPRDAFVFLSPQLLSQADFHSDVFCQEAHNTWSSFCNDDSHWDYFNNFIEVQFSYYKTHSF